MADINELKAQHRPRSGTGSARAIRRAGLVPAVIYGERKPTQSIAIDRGVLDKELHTGHFLTTLYDIELDGETTRVIPRDVQTDPVRDFPIHVDFLRLGSDSKIAVDVGVRFLHEELSPGLKRGGVLNVVRHTIELECPADSIPDSIEVDLTGLDINDAVHISSVTLPQGVVPTIRDRDFTIATIAAPAGMEADEEEEEVAADAVELVSGREADKDEAKEE
jgi:large subunit ribosomal protein L25